MNFQQSSQRLKIAELDLQKKLGTKENLIERQSELEQHVGYAKGRLVLKPDVDVFLETLQMEVNEKTVGAYQKLLTAVVQDVLGKDKHIGLELHTDRGVPGLDIFIDAGDGKKEDIVNGAGGSMTNVVSLGLRVIATVRSGLRKFVAMDEPDCWISPENVTKFYSVIGDLSNKLGVQSFIISHHDIDLLPSEFTTSSLFKEGSKIGLNQATRYEWNADEKGIRKLHLKNFMSHSDTELHLHPGANAIIGQNNIGKSVFIRALRALAYGEASDSDIKHDEKMLSVAVEIENNVVVRFTRQKRRNPVNEWTLEDLEGNVRTDREQNTQLKPGGRQVPECRAPNCAMQTVAGFHQQLSHQKFPVFLLGESPSQRAHVLSIGKETSHVQSMIARQKERIKEDTAIVKTGESELNEIFHKLDKLSQIENIQKTVQDLNDAAIKITQDIEAISKIDSLISNIAELNQTKERLQKHVNVVSPNVEYSLALNKSYKKITLFHRKLTSGTALKPKTNKDKRNFYF